MAMIRLCGALLFAFLLTSGPHTKLSGATRWEVQFYHDEDDSELTILDFAFPSLDRGVAVGYLTEKGKVRPRVLLTSDGGNNWSFLPVREIGHSLFFLNDSLGWMVTERAIWQTQESGRTWRRLKKLRGLLRVHFLDEVRGWAVGIRKSVYGTTDGGRQWSKLPAAAEPKTTPDYTTYGWIEFANSKVGAIVGWSSPPQRARSGYPEWMDPERAQRRQLPALTVVLQTRDGGKTWESSASSLFGRITRLRLMPRGRGLALVEFQDAFQWPSEVYRIDLPANKTERAFRREDRAVTDIALVGDNAGYLAAVEPVGTLRQSPVPGRLAVLRSSDLTHWEEMEVDYRAYARRAMLAAPDASHVWVATDTGMILRLIEE